MQMTGGHPLDRPVWNALTGRQAHLARGGSGVLRIDPDYGLFVTTADFEPETLLHLEALVPTEGALAAIEPAPLPAPGLERTEEPITQMWAPKLGPAPPRNCDIVPLTDADGAQMLALATLTEPGPFFSRTHQLGDFVGVKVDGQIAAMAGERMRLPGFTEVSAVCTHPDHRGKGYAAALTHLVASRISARGETPFLHCYPHNRNAISVYQALGFTVRRELVLTILSRRAIEIPGH